MKKLIIISMIMMVAVSFFAETVIPAGGPKPATSPQGYRLPSPRTAPTFSFSVPPVSLLTNYYDYMIGSYDLAPIQVIPDAAGGGYFLTYHARRQPTSTRRIFYAYIDAAGNIINNNEITNQQVHEGFGALAVDPVSGKPFYAWHANNDADANLETLLVYDQFPAGIAGIFSGVHTIAEAPMMIDPPSFEPTTDNEFIWPTLVVGPSPIEGKRRLYGVMKNYVTHTINPSSNILIAYADFTTDDLEFGDPLTFNFTTIPMLDDWNHDPNNWRRTFMSVSADESGNVYYSGYHFAQDAEENDIDEGDVIIFKNDNYGMGNWELVYHYSNVPAWNPPTGPSDPTGYFANDSDVPYPDDAMSWNITNSTHLNAAWDSNGKIHLPLVYGLSTNESTYYPNLQFVKSLVFNPANDQFNLVEVYPVKDPEDTHNSVFTPWDIEAPWGVVDEWGGTAPDTYPLMVTDWPFPHWDTTAHTDAMLFHYNNYKMTNANNGWMAAVWQNSWRARQANEYQDPDYAAWANVPEINISLSSSNGSWWYEPVVLNNIEVPEMTGIKPMWVYPADKPILLGQVGDDYAVKLGLMFYDDYTWGSNSQSPPYHPNADGGRTMFMELVFNVSGWSTDDPTTPSVTNVLHQNYPNPFNPTTSIDFDMPVQGTARLEIFNVKGQLVKTLVNSELNVGRHSYVWDGTDESGAGVSSGIFFYRLSGEGWSQTRKMMLVK